MTTLLAWTLGAVLAGAGLIVLRARRRIAGGGDAIQLVTTRYLGAKRFLTLVAHGEVVVVNEKFGIRLTDVISPAERIRKLR